MTTIAITAPLLGTVRSALLSELGGVAGLIDGASMTADREQHYEWFEQPVEQFDAYRELLDLVGWSDPEQEATRFIHLDVHRWALTTALEARLAIEREYAKVEPHLKGAAEQKRTAEQYVREIETFLAELPEVQR